MSLVIARPRGGKIERGLLHLLAAAGVDTDGADVIPPGTPDDEALARIGAVGPSSLLVPVHAHRSRDGELLNGIELITGLGGKLYAALPILVPMTGLERTVLDLAMARPEGAGGIPEFLRSWLIPIDTDRLDDPEVIGEVVRRVADLTVDRSAPDRA